MEGLLAAGGMKKGAEAPNLLNVGKRLSSIYFTDSTAINVKVSRNAALKITISKAFFDDFGIRLSQAPARFSVCICQV